MNYRALILIAAGMFMAISAIMLQARRDVRSEIAALAVASDSAQLMARDAELLEEIDHIRLQLERARGIHSAQAALHLSLAITDQRLMLERGDVLLREVPVESGIARGVRTIISVGARAVVLSDSAVIRASTSADAAPVTAADSAAHARSVRLRPTDYAALLPNLKVGSAVYVH